MSAEGRAGARYRISTAVEAELRAAMLLTGCRDVAALRRAPRVVLEPLASLGRRSLASAALTRPAANEDLEAQISRDGTLEG